jgi:flavin reductase (DIM6/NTAB) family NADH-FMN oxidoreductase RutF
MARVELNPERWMDHPALARETHARMANEGILLASLDPAGKLNPMTIGWGVFGWIWGRPIFTVLVRPSRYTYGCIEATGDFTVNVQPADRKDIPSLCGTLSGRDYDKVSELDLTPLPSRHILSPGIAECSLVFECKVVHKNDILPPELPEDIKSEYYPDGDFHRVYFGRILGVSAEQEFFEQSK